jgi:hypothetical protein
MGGQCQDYGTGGMQGTRVGSDDVLVGIKIYMPLRKDDTFTGVA